ncbi:uncharacterized protein LOC115214297 isoform X1 [Argonauta hians]
MLLEKFNVIMNFFYLAFLAMLSISFTQGAHNQCPPNNYYSTMFERCINCSTCPDNEIIRTPCGPYEDLTCGPFVEFNHFVVGEKHKLQNRSKNHHQFWKPNPHKPMIRPSINTDYQKPRVNQPASVTTINQDTTPWKTIALSLISIICTSVLLLLVAVIYVHFNKKRNASYDKEVIYETNESGLSEVCYSTLALDYMQKTRPSSALWMYTPAYHKSQDLLLNQHPEPDASTPFANTDSTVDSCTENEHCSASCTHHNRDSNIVKYSHRLHPPYVTPETSNISSSNINTNSCNQSVCSCNNHFPDYVFFNLAQNEYLEK